MNCVDQKGNVCIYLIFSFSFYLMGSPPFFLKMTAKLAYS